MRLERIINRKIFNDVRDKITDRHRIEISKILLKYDSKQIGNRLKNILGFITYDVDSTISWVDRLDIIVNEIGFCNSTDYALEIRYGKENIELARYNVSKNKGTSLEKCILRYGEIEGRKKYDEICKIDKVVWGLENSIKKYGEEEGKVKWEAMLKKKVDTMAERKKIKPYRNGQTLEEYKDRYGDVEGEKKYYEKNNKIKYRFSKKYYKDTYGDEWKKHYTKYKESMVKTTLESFIERYGVKNGTERYNKFVERQSYCQSYEYYVEKFGIDNAEKERKKYLDKVRFKNVKYSKISQELFDEVEKEVIKILPNNKSYYATKNGEFFITLQNEKNNGFYLDYKISNVIIEFDGDYWHSGEEQKKYDEYRDELLMNEGYCILRVKEGDYKKNKEKIVKQVIDYITKNIKLND